MFLIFLNLSHMPIIRFHEIPWILMIKCELNLGVCPFKPNIFLTDKPTQNQPCRTGFFLKFY